MWVGEVSSPLWDSWLLTPAVSSSRSPKFMSSRGRMPLPQSRLPLPHRRSTCSQRVTAPISLAAALEERAEAPCPPLRRRVSPVAGMSAGRGGGRQLGVPSYRPPPISGFPEAPVCRDTRVGALLSTCEPGGPCIPDQAGWGTTGVASYPVAIAQAICHRPHRGSAVRAEDRITCLWISCSAMPS